MPNGFTSTGGFNQRRIAATFFSSPYGNTPYTAIVYRTPQTQSATALALLTNGNSQSSRISKFNLSKSLNRQMQNSYN